MEKLNYYIEYFVAPSLKETPLLYRKAKVFVILISFCQLISVFLCIASLFYPANVLPIFMGILLLGAIIYWFRQTGNLKLAGNLLAGIWATVLISAIPSTGGFYSDNLLWLIVAPLIALLFSDKKSGYYWLGFLLLFITVLFFYEVSTKSKVRNVAVFDAGYYLISYIFLFVMLFGVATIFETGQELIIKMLTNQKTILEEQKAEIVKKTEELQVMQEKLRESNQDLEKFAYAASHDMKEPLRMINMYTQLTKRRMESQLDDRTREYMGFVTGGVHRMQHFLDDLLKYARLGKREGSMEEADLGEIIEMVKDNLTATIQETNAYIHYKDLPTLKIYPTEMLQLFQNLMANSIKFRKKDVAPYIEVTCKEDNFEYLFTLKDNGIGIAPEYYQRVFGVFERLHGLSDYEGSGIGLATCKKIVESLGGNIWLTSEVGVGTNFYFTIPKQIHPN